MHALRFRRWLAAAVTFDKATADTSVEELTELVVAEYTARRAAARLGRMAWPLSPAPRPA